MGKMKVVEVNSNHQFNHTNRDIPEPKANQVRVKIKACGVCHSDMYAKEGLWPDIHYPRVPGHEVAGTIDAVGSEVTQWKVGQRVGIGWTGFFCGYCKVCRRGNFVGCENKNITGIHFDGGYSEYMIAPVQALALIPDELTFEEAAPLLCAGITTFNALRHSLARPGDLVAIQGIGGLGHLALQFSNKMGFKTVALSKGKEKESLAKKLGAHIYLNTENENYIPELQKLGGAKVILATAPNAKAITPLINGLGHESELIIVAAASDPIEVNALQIIAQKRSIRGWASGSAIDSEDTMKFCAQTGIRPMIEKFPLEKAEDAYNHMLSNKARFRSVITP